MREEKEEMKKENRKEEDEDKDEEKVKEEEEEEEEEEKKKKRRRRNRSRRIENSFHLMRALIGVQPLQNSCQDLLKRCEEEVETRFDERRGNSHQV